MQGLYVKVNIVCICVVIRRSGSSSDKSIVVVIEIFDNEEGSSVYILEGIMKVSLRIERDIV